MSLDYPDWSTPSWTIDQSAQLYFADVYATMIETPTITDRKLIKENGILYVWEHLRVKDNGVLMIMGTLRVLGD
mgnify:CR=1 FL=1